MLEVENIFNLSIEQTQQRRKSSVKEPSMSYTNKAIMTFMESISKMNEGVLVPSKLKDIEVSETEATSLMPAKSDLFSFYKMLNNVKHDLFSTSKYLSAFNRKGSFSQNGSGQNSGRTSPSPTSRRPSSTAGMYGIPNLTNGSGTSPNSSRTLQTPTFLPLDRRNSNGYLDSSPETPINNNFLSPTSPNIPLIRATSLNTLLLSNDFDDLSPTDVSTEEQVEHVTACFNHHLSALYTILGHFTRGADFILDRYQKETENGF